MSLPIIPAVVVSGVVYVAATSQTAKKPLPKNPYAPPPGATVQQIRNLRASSKLFGIYKPDPKKGGGPLALDPTLKMGSQPPPGGNDPATQAALDAAYAAAKAKFDTLDDDAKATAAGEINKQFNLTANSTPPALTADQSTSWETVASVAGAAAGAAVGGYIGGPFGAKVGALLGAYLGVKLEDWLAANVGSVFEPGGALGGSTDAELQATFGSFAAGKASIVAKYPAAANEPINSWNDWRRVLVQYGMAALAGSGVAGFPHF